MPSNKSKFTPALKQRYDFLTVMRDSESRVFCSLCSRDFSIANGGKADIEKHIKSYTHEKAKGIVSRNQSMDSFLSSDPVVMQLNAKELVFAYHTGRHNLSGPTAACTSSLVSKCFEPRFTGGKTKTAMLIQKVKIKILRNVEF